MTFRPGTDNPREDPPEGYEGVCSRCGRRGFIYPGTWGFLRENRPFNLCRSCLARLLPREGNVTRLADLG